MRFAEIMNRVPRRALLQALLRHIKEQIDPAYTMSELMGAYEEVREHLVFPLKVYRAFAWDDLNDARMWDADDQPFEDEAEEYAHATQLISQKIDFSRVGIYWTWDRDAAKIGGALDNATFDRHLILEATVTRADVDIDTTLVQNLTVYQEEMEVRLWPGRDIRITGSWPALPNLPRRAHTGPEGWDTRADGNIADVLKHLRLPQS